MQCEYFYDSILVYAFWKFVFELCPSRVLLLLYVYNLFAHLIRFSNNNSKSNSNYNNSSLIAYIIYIYYIK